MVNCCDSEKHFEVDKLMKRVGVLESEVASDSLLRKDIRDLFRWHNENLEKHREVGEKLDKLGKAFDLMYVEHRRVRAKVEALEQHDIAFNERLAGNELRKGLYEGLDERVELLESLHDSQKQRIFKTEQHVTELETHLTTAPALLYALKERIEALEKKLAAHFNDDVSTIHNMSTVEEDVVVWKGKKYKLLSQEKRATIDGKGKWLQLDVEEVVDEKPKSMEDWQNIQYGKVKEILSEKSEPVEPEKLEWFTERGFKFEVGMNGYSITIQQSGASIYYLCDKELSALMEAVEVARELRERGEKKT